MSGRFVALLRGINVGRAKRVAMVDLRGLCLELGFEGVRTLLNSGNVVFDAKGNAKKHAQVLITGIKKTFGFSADVLVLSEADALLVDEENELLEVATTPSRLLICLWRDHPSARKKVLALTRKDWGAEQIHVGKRAAYVWSPDGVLASEILKALEVTLEGAVTSRNASTWARVVGAL